MKIWLLSTESQPATSGIARSLDYAAEALAAAGCSVTVLTPGDQEAEMVTAAGVRIRSFAAARRQLQPDDDQTEAHPAYPANILSDWPALSFQMARFVESLAAQE